MLDGHAHELVAQDCRQTQNGANLSNRCAASERDSSQQQRPNHHILSRYLVFDHFEQNDQMFCETNQPDRLSQQN